MGGKKTNFDVFSRFNYKTAFLVMAEVILMPRLSDTMTEGVIAAWHKKVGDTVKKGDLLAEIETDKATMELESYQDGVLLHIGTPRGGKLQVNDLLAIFGKADEDISALITSANAVPVAVKAAEEIPKPTESSNAAPAASGVDYTKMEEVVLMPRLSDTMTEGVIAGWQKKVGDAVKKGEVLADIETDKATMELESYKDRYTKLQTSNDQAMIQEYLRTELAKIPNINTKVQNQSGIKLNIQIICDILTNDPFQ